MKKVIFIFLVFFIIAKNVNALTVTRGTPYKYVDIKTCYLEGQENSVSTTTIKSVEKKGCLQLDPRGAKVDRIRLETENACPEGYNLENICQGEDQDRVCGSFCQKKLEKTETLYCVYPTWNRPIMLVYKNNTIEIRENDKSLSQYDQDGGEYLLPNGEATTDKQTALYVPFYDDESWRQTTYTFKFMHTNNYVDGVLKECPRYIFELESRDSLVFSDDEEKTSEALEGKLWDVPHYVRRKTFAIEYIDTSTEGNNSEFYYDAFFGGAELSCENYMSGLYTKSCSYYIGGENSIVLFMGESAYTITSDRRGIEMRSVFTFNDLKEKNNGNCPNELWYGSQYGFYLSLENTPEPGHYYNKLSLTSSNNEIIPPRYCWPDMDLDQITNSCEGILGNPEVEESPAWYLQIIFEVMKYIAILILIALSTLDFVGAISSHDDNKIKDAMRKTVIRLICCVIIFVLPVLIKFILTFLDVYSPSTCGIE